MNSISKSISKKSIASLLILGILLIGLWQADAITAAPAATTADINRITLRDGFDRKVRTTFGQGARLTASIRIRDRRSADDGTYGPFDEQQYIVTIHIEDSNEDVIYDGRTLRSTAGRIALKPSERDEVDVVWNVPYGSPRGAYKIYASVYPEEFPNRLLHKAVKSFNITERSNSSYIHLSDSSINFGDVVKNEKPEDGFIIARRNRNAGDFLWQVVEWPYEWLELLEPDISPTNPKRSVEVANTGNIRLKVRQDALKGNFSDDVVINSNAGSFTVKVSANINRRASGEITRLRLTSNRLNPGNDLTANFRIRNTGEASVIYRSIFYIHSPTGALAYESNTAGDDVLTQLDAGKSSDALEFRWRVPFGSAAGEYTVAMELRSSHEFSLPAFDEIPADSSDAETFRVLQGAKIAVSPREWSFGSVQEGDGAPPATFSVSNKGKFILKWEVTGLPEWLELVRPSSAEMGDGDVIVRIKDNIPPSAYKDNLEITSNGGVALIPLSLNIMRGPTPTPTTIIRPSSTPTATYRPTYTPTPTHTHTPTHTPHPTYTHTPTPTPTATPTATHTPTHTPIPTLTTTPTITHTPTHIPSATPAATHTQTATITPAPPSPTHTQTPTPANPTAPASGGCNIPTQASSPLIGMVNTALLLSPAAFAALMRRLSARSQK